MGKSSAALDRLAHHARFIEAVHEGLDDVEQGRVVSDAELKHLLDQRFGALASPEPRRRSPLHRS